MLQSYHPRFRINRNIMECKAGQVEAERKEQLQVLIETLWNVKQEFMADPYPGIFCINRNIMECKDRCKSVQVSVDVQY